MKAKNRENSAKALRSVKAALKPPAPAKKNSAALTRAVAPKIVADKLTVLTIGHSTRTIEEFISILQTHGVQLLVDVRSIPKSRRVPQFNSDALAASLRKKGIEYAHLATLGGLRHARKDSINTGWRNASFRGYADYMATQGFHEGLDRLLQLAKTKRTAIMCAEAVPWRCHRSLIGDALLVRGVQVEDIMSATSSRPHELTSFAQVQDKTITYPAPETLDANSHPWIFRRISSNALLSRASPTRREKPQCRTLAAFLIFSVCRGSAVADLLPVFFQDPALNRRFQGVRLWSHQPRGPQQWLRAGRSQQRGEV